MLPKHGIVHGAFLLAFTARVAQASTRAQLIAAARKNQSFLSHATDLEIPATSLVNLNLLREEQGSITVGPQLEALSFSSDRRSMVAIARLFLLGAPPVWLWLAGASGEIRREYIPEEDLKALEWLEPELISILEEVYFSISNKKDIEIIKKIGDAAEEIMVAAYSLSKLNPIHVAKFHDGCGYDIEIDSNYSSKIEVKAASTNTQGKFHLTRNEYEKCKTYRDKWCLIQVVFKNESFFAENITSNLVDGIWQVSSETIIKSVPNDTDLFRWTEAAELNLDPSYWTRVDIKLDPNFKTTGFQLEKL